jgi:molybdate transport system regulatory protein
MRRERCYSDAMTRITLRIEFDESRALGPGKVRLLELVAETGSISAAGRAMGMSYRRAWLLVDALNQTFRTPVVQTRGGGVGGGGAVLTKFGGELVANYRAMECEARDAMARRLADLERALAPAEA